MTATETYNKLMEIKDQFPELTFNNDGYEYISPSIREAHKEQIKQIEDLLRPVIPTLRRFDNFKPRKDGSFAIRCQYGWSESFTGVGYFEKADFEKADSNA